MRDLEDGDIVEIQVGDTVERHIVDKVIETKPLGWRKPGEDAPVQPERWFIVAFKSGRALTLKDSDAVLIVR